MCYSCTEKHLLASRIDSLQQQQVTEPEVVQHQVVVSEPIQVDDSEPIQQQIKPEILYRNFQTDGQSIEETISRVFEGVFDYDGIVRCSSDRLECAGTIVTGHAFCHYKEGYFLVVWDVGNGLVEKLPDADLHKHGIKWLFENSFDEAKAEAKREAAEAEKLAKAAMEANAKAELDLAGLKKLTGLRLMTIIPRVRMVFMQWKMKMRVIF